MDAVIGEHDLVLVAAELGNVLGRLLEPSCNRLAVEIRGRQLDHAEALALELVEQRLEQRVGDDRDAAGAGIGVQRRIASRRRSSSSGS
jgi:hypothetical protein